MSVEEDYSGSDHLPLYANFNFRIINDSETVSEAHEKIK